MIRIAARRVRLLREVPVRRLETAPSGTQFRGGILTTSGPILRQDHYLVQEMQVFNRERVPEPVVHATGGGAFGHFQVTADVTRWTKATDGCSDAITV